MVKELGCLRDKVRKLQDEEDLKPKARLEDLSVYQV
jgi:hypothetical protein